MAAEPEPEQAAETETGLRPELIRQRKPKRQQAEKIRMLREAGYRGVIAVDGGVSLDNAKMIKDAGADWLIMGTSYFRAEDPEMVARKVREMA